VIFTIILWLPFILAAQKTEPIILGYAHEIRSTILNESRTLNVYLPAGYQDDDSTSYPVIYLLDGSLDEDFIHGAGLVQYHALPWVERLPPSILVGIANVDRRRDFAFPTTFDDEKKKWPTTGGSAAFIDFIEKEAQPYIQSQFRTTRDRMLIGQSLGGLLATEILLRKPYLFNQYVIISPSLWWNDGSLIAENWKSLEKSISSPTEVYIGVGKEGLTPGAVVHVMEVDANLLYDQLLKVHNDNLKIGFDYLPEEDHGTISHQAVINAFRLFTEWKEK
jgi:predicted alpha/beta superfamily hydrolase